jgi:predicted alternative tryptophan synthase beta-subunit
MGLDCTVYMVRVSYDQKPYRRIIAMCVIAASANIHEVFQR